MFGSALLGMALCGVRLGSSWLGSGLGPSSVPLGSVLVRDSGWAGLALGWLLGVRLTSVLGSGSAWGSVSGLGNQLDARLGSARSLARAQLGVRSEIGSGLATRDLVSWARKSRSSVRLI